MIIGKKGIASEMSLLKQRIQLTITNNWPFIWHETVLKHFLLLESLSTLGAEILDKLTIDLNALISLKEFKEKAKMGMP